MRRPCGALLCSVALSWSAAAPSFSQSGHPDDPDPRDPPAPGALEISFELDVDGLAALADSQGVAAGPHTDIRFRLDAEAVAASGIRWGGAFEAAARSRDGRRGLQSRTQIPGDRPGLVTGLGGSGLDPDFVAGLTRAEIYVKQGFFELHAGQGPTAARRERFAPASALRLAGADGALFDPLGAGLVDTGLSVTAPAPHVSVRTRRLAGLALAASYTPNGDACGVDRCLDAAFGEVERVVSAALSFDRRARGAARWRVLGAFEAAQATPGPLSRRLEDPWLAAFQLVREDGDVTLAVNASHVRDGAPGMDYRAVSVFASVESGDWLFDAELGQARSDAADREGWTAQAGASRLLGRRGLAGLAVQLQSEGGGAALIAEAGLRF